MVNLSIVKILWISKNLAFPCLRLSWVVEMPWVWTHPGRFGAGKQLGSFAPRNELAPGSSTNQMSSVAKLEKFDSNTLCVFSGLLQKQECQVKLKAGY